MIPLSWRIGAVAALVAALFAAGYASGHKHAKAQWALADAVRAQAESAAILKRVAENAKIETQQAADNAAITKAKNEDLAPVRAAIAAAPRLRVGPAVCPGHAPAPDPTGAGGGAAADPGAGLVRQDVDRDIRALMTTVEDALATGRACQQFVAANGMGEAPK